VGGHSGKPSRGASPVASLRHCELGAQGIASATGNHHPVPQFGIDQQPKPIAVVGATSEMFPEIFPYRLVAEDSGTYELRAGLYRPSDGWRVPLQGAEGRVKDSAMILGQVQVQ